MIGERPATPAWFVAASHLYPGARLRPESVALTTGEILIFAANNLTAGVLSVDANGFRLQVEEYTTPTGAQIPQKIWRLRIDEGQLVVLARI
ncbi:hypothetical protein FGL91_13310 [Microbacterium sp. CBA3102]|uniref:hypothetical protein n=1 Tax=Microbacterium sp. CBA3102 TaxID=2603598 RepID=UPI0011BAED02|nr:hypothetical protein [Microbacterium sp. CBA3102]QEA29451.1 hypothetical protein FGL91_13310 [Microbacterium sp. CBA3102]